MRPRVDALACSGKRDQAVKVVSYAYALSDLRAVVLPMLGA